MGLLSPPTAAPSYIYRTPSSATMSVRRSPATAPIPVGRSPGTRSATIQPSTPAMYPAALSPPSQSHYTPKSPPKALPTHVGSTPGGYPTSPYQPLNLGGTPKGLTTPMSLRSELYPSEKPKRRERSSSFSRGPIPYHGEVFEDSGPEDYFTAFPFYEQRGRSATSLPLNSYSPFHPPSALSSRIATPRKSVSFGLPPDYVPVSRSASRSRSRARDDDSRAHDHYTGYTSGYHDHDRGRSRSRSQSRGRTTEDRPRPRVSSQSYVPSYLPMQSPYSAPPPQGHGGYPSPSATPGGSYQIYKPLSPPSAPPPMTPMMAYTSPNPGHLHRSFSTHSHHHPGHRRRNSDTQSLMMGSPRTPLLHQPHSIGPVYPERHRSHSRSHSSSRDKARVYQVPSSPGYYPVTISNNVPLSPNPGQYYYHYHHRSKGPKHSKSHSPADVFDTKVKHGRRSSTSAISPTALTNVLVRKESDRERKDRKDRERTENDARHKEKERQRRKEKEWMKRWKDENARLQRRGSQMSMPMMYGGYAVGVPMAPATEASLKPKKQVRFRRGSF